MPNFDPEFCGENVHGEVVRDNKTTPDDTMREHATINLARRRTASRHESKRVFEYGGS